MVFENPLPSIVKKMRLNARLIALIPASRIHAGWIPDDPDKNPGIYVSPARSSLRQVISSANQSAYVLAGPTRWQVDALSTESIEKAELLARAACEACLPSIKAAGLYGLNFSLINVFYDKTYGAYRSTYRLESPYSEHITG